MKRCSTKTAIFLLAVYLPMWLLSSLHPLELKAGLFHSFAHIVGKSGAGYDEGVGGGGGLAGCHPFQFAHGILHGCLAVVAVHALNGVNHGALHDILFLEFAEKFHTQSNYDE